MRDRIEEKQNISKKRSTRTTSSMEKRTHSSKQLGKILYVLLCHLSFCFCTRALCLLSSIDHHKILLFSSTLQPTMSAFAMLACLLSHTVSYHVAISMVICTLTVSSICSCLSTQIPCPSRIQNDPQ